MKRQQAISRFFAPKTASSSGTPSNSTPSTSSHANRRPLETPPSVIGSPRALAPEAESLGFLEGLEESPVEIEAPKLQKRKLSRLKENTVFPESDPVRHQRFVEKLVAQSDQNRGLQESWYEKPPPNGRLTYTPLESQVVELKARYPDVVLLIEVGYKYRFFGGDAETAARVLGIFAHYDHNFLTASIPTFRLHVHVRRLVESGYKVGVVRQTETAAIKAHGSNKAGPFTRGLSALYTRATLEAAEDLGGENEGHVGRLNNYLMCIAEEPLLHGRESNKGKDVGSLRSVDDDDSRYYDTRFGVVAVEIATGDVMYGDFKDTVMRSELEARLLTCTPAELLLAMPISSTTEKLVMEFAGPTGEIRVEHMTCDAFRDGGAMAEVLSFYGIKAERNTICTSITSEEELLPEYEKINPGLEAVMAMPDIVARALAFTLRYLKQFNLEKVLLSGASFRLFTGQTEMSLSPNTLRQLEILRNNADGSGKGSLLWRMDHTQTAFGARLLRHWVTHPLLDHALIKARLDAVTEIMDSMSSVGVSMGAQTFSWSGWDSGHTGALSRHQQNLGQHGLLASLLMSLGRLPDVQRGITRIFLRTATAAEFVTVIQALITAAKQLRCLQFTKVEENERMNVEEGPKGVRSPLLQRLIATASSMTMSEHAAQLLLALNTDAAASGDKLNLFLCEGGRFPQVAKCRVAIKAAEQQLDDFLPSLRKLLRMPRLEFLSVAGTTHLVEVPAAQKVPADWIKVNSTKKANRFHPPGVLATLDRLALANEELKVACGQAWDAFLVEFAAYYVDFQAAVQSLAALDCLHSLALVAQNQGYVRPDFVDESQPSQLVIEAGRHPVLESTLQDGFVPNDTVLHSDQERCQIITGPNMGGKSCYIRQVALIAIMAQIGSYVPAASAKMHVVDAVFTRMGASDTIQKGSSTFFEELSEASEILQRATSRSLVIIDELGRGTSTHDGVALASATLQHLLKETRCLTLFVTHYLKIAELKTTFSGEVGTYFVSYMTKDSLVNKNSLPKTNEVEQQPDSREDTTQRITFLYKLVPGVASRSFGLHVARLAQIPETCVVQAAAMATKLEMEVSARENTASTNPGKLSLQEKTQGEVEINGSERNNRFDNCMSQVGNLGIMSDTIAKDYLSRAYTEQLGSIFLLLETLADHGSLDHALSALNLAQNQAKLFLEEFS
ncbi:unnamed protein product [Sphagnum compactum]